jgi:hypothetical protein
LRALKRSREEDAYGENSWKAVAFPPPLGEREV